MRNAETFPNEDLKNRICCIFHSQLSGSYYLILYITDKIQNFIEKLEDTKGVIRSRNSNDRKYSGKERDDQIM